MCEMPTFICVLRLAKSKMFEKMSPEEEAIMEEHFERLKDALREGNLILAGPCLDGAFGIVVFRAECEEKAEDFMKNDPAVKHKIMSAELHPFRVSLIKK